MERIGIIDLGSNTARLLIVDMFAEGHFMVVDELKESVRLGQDMDRDGFLKPQRIAETIKTLKMFKRLCDASGVERIIAVGTAAVRRAKNQRSFLDEIQVSCNITIRVLSEEEEALLVYRGVINSMDIPKGLILEIGGGSTKIIYYNRRNVLGYASLPFGAVTLTDLFANDATPDSATAAANAPGLSLMVPRTTHHSHSPSRLLTCAWIAGSATEEWEYELFMSSQRIFMTYYGLRPLPPWRVMVSPVT